jgi:chromosome segregation ATPase
MTDCDTIDARLAEAEALLDNWKTLLTDTQAAIKAAQQAIVSILQGDNEVPFHLFRALEALYAQRDWLNGEIATVEAELIELEKEKKDCDEQQAQG